ncbi:MAG: exo-beta-N-acetylmuramidase NamZ family protein [Chlamydiia bacterium]
MLKLGIFLGSFFCLALFGARVEVGLDRVFHGGAHPSIKGKRIGLLTNHTALDRDGISSVEKFQLRKDCKLVTLFAPEHGLNGQQHAAENVKDSKKGGVPVYSLHGSSRRPSESQLKGLDVVVYDIQDIGVRSYTYASSLYYMMEEAAKRNIEVVVLDRPNPINGLIVDGPMLHTKWRSFIGYVNVPYIHGMTIGELAQFFNTEYKVGAKLTVIPMKGWNRGMEFKDTGLNWIPTSPNIPEPDTPLFYATTGLLGELRLCNIGIGYTLPFKLVGAPWMDASQICRHLNRQGLNGVRFVPIYFKPFSGSMAQLECQGALIQVLDRKTFRPFQVQGLIMGAIKQLYPQKFKEVMAHIGKSEKDLFCKAMGSDEPLQFLKEDKLVGWQIAEFQRAERELFMEKRKNYLRIEYTEDYRPSV